MQGGGLVLADIQGADDVGMVEQGAALGLAIKAIDVALIAGQVLAEDLDGDLLVLAFVIAQIDRSHAAFAQAAQNAILAEAAHLMQEVARRDGRLGLRRVWVGLVHDVHRSAVSLKPGRLSQSRRWGGRSLQGRSLPHHGLL